MAIELNLSYARSEDNTYITVTDNTGIYNATTNEGGYGGVNPATTDFSTFSITVTPCDAETLLPTGTPAIISAYSTLPSAAGGSFDLTSEAIIGSADTVLPDGWYLFEVAADYNDGATEGTVTLTTNKIFFSIVQCCIWNLLVKKKVGGCHSGGDDDLRLLMAQGWLDELEQRVNETTGEVIESVIDSCDQYNKAVTILGELQDICDNNNCGGCSTC